MFLPLTYISLQPLSSPTLNINCFHTQATSIIHTRITVLSPSHLLTSHAPYKQLTYAPLIQDFCPVLCACLWWVCLCLQDDRTSHFLFFSYSYLFVFPQVILRPVFTAMHSLTLSLNSSSTFSWLNKYLNSSTLISLPTTILHQGL